MSKEARLVWKDGFPSATRMIADGEYQLTIERLNFEASKDYLKVCVVFAHDSEYQLWREMYRQEGSLPSFAKQIPGAVEWREFILVWVFPLKALDHVSRETALIGEYVDFLNLAHIELTPPLMPKVEWVEG